MRVANVGVYVRDESPLREHAVLRRSGEPWAWLDLGEAGEASLYGSPAAMRRLAASVTAAVAAAERLPDDPEPSEAALRVVAGS